MYVQDCIPIKCNSHPLAFVCFQLNLERPFIRNPRVVTANNPRQPMDMPV
jgi:hypothetical protein